MRYPVQKRFLQFEIPVVIKNGRPNINAVHFDLQPRQQVLHSKIYFWWTSCDTASHFIT